MNPTRQTTPTPDLDPVMTPADLLRGAALYLQHHGWAQGHFFDPILAITGQFPPACALGAIRMAAFGDVESVLNGGTSTDVHSANSASVYFASYLASEYDPCETSYIDVIGDWNDYSGRTVDEVIDALTDAADNWDGVNTPGGAR